MDRALKKKNWRTAPWIFLLLPLISLTGCLSHQEDLRGVPVTNNPSLNPWGSTAQGPIGTGPSGRR